ncbi:clathrin adaptor domain-containing protein, putative [Plasmodium vivax]|uniref:Clathrin adaptor domain-containing protein, putative n=1 Tax=Plasmodium vivax TaxID=5855 RepID=A0A565A318_PLAVI|nr:clathrin adaptor domain-containing protein, putative [Plasmodium vivax]
MTICNSRYKNTGSEEDKLLFKTCTESTEYLHLYFRELKEHLCRHRKYEELFNFCYGTLRNIKNPAISRTTALKVIGIAFTLNPKCADLPVSKDIITYAYKLLKRNEEGTNKKYFTYFGHSTNKEKESLLSESINLFKTTEAIKERQQLKDQNFINTIFSKIEKKQIFIAKGCSVSYSPLLSDFTNAKRDLLELLETEFVSHGKVDRVYSDYVRCLNEVKERTIEFLENGEYDLYCRFIDEMQEEDEINVRYESYLLSCPELFNEKDDKDSNRETTPTQREQLKPKLGGTLFNNQVASEEASKRTGSMTRGVDNHSEVSNERRSVTPPVGSNSRKKVNEKGEAKSLSKNISNSITKFASSFVRNAPSGEVASGGVEPNVNNEGVTVAEGEVVNQKKPPCDDGSREGGTAGKLAQLPPSGNTARSASVQRDNNEGDGDGENGKKKKAHTSKKKNKELPKQLSEEATVLPDGGASPGGAQVDTKKKASFNKTVAFDLVGTEKAAQDPKCPGKNEAAAREGHFNEKEMQIINEFNAYLNEGVSHLRKQPDGFKKECKEFKNSIHDGNNALWDSLIKKSNFYSIKEDFLNYNKFLKAKEKDAKEQTLGDLLGMNKYIELKKKKSKSKSKGKSKNRKMNPDELNCIINKFTNNLSQSRPIKIEHKVPAEKLTGGMPFTPIGTPPAIAQTRSDKRDSIISQQRNDATHISSCNKYFTKNDNISYVQDAVLKNGSLLLRDDNLEISLSQHYYGNNGLIKIYVKNKKLVNYYDVDIQISNKILFPLKFKFLNYERMLCANGTNCYEMVVKCAHMYKGFPLIKISYRMQDMFRKSIELRLPIPINKFMKNIKITKDVFVKFWNNENFNIYKKEKVIHKADSVDTEQIVAISCLGNALSVCYIEDAIYLSGCYADNASALDNYFVLVGIEVLRNKLKIICKSNNPTLSSAILFLIILILKKHDRV